MSIGVDSSPYIAHLPGVHSWIATLVVNLFCLVACLSLVVVIVMMLALLVWIAAEFIIWLTRGRILRIFR